MPDYGKTKVVDGFTALRAIQQGKGSKRNESNERETREPETVKPEPAARPSGRGIGRTVMPTKFEIICYKCGFEYCVTGRADYTYCPKCRERLERTDHVITGALTQNLVTVGKVHLTETASIDSATVVAREFILEGTVKSGRVEVTGMLEIGPNASYTEKLITARDLRIPAASKVTLRSHASYRNVEVMGRLKAKLRATGVITVKPGALLKGDIRGAHLVVEEGGGVFADLVIEPDKAHEAENDKGVPAQKTA